jgi:hypothetical protein
MNMDTKMLNKLFGKKIQQHVVKIIHHGWAGFIPGKQIWFNICKTINTMQYLNRIQWKNYIIISIDAKKPLTNLNTFSWLYIKKKNLVKLETERNTST